MEVNTPELLRNSGPVKCPVCDREFRNAHALAVHKGQAHAPGGPRTWKRYAGGSRKSGKKAAPTFSYTKTSTKCPICHKEFSTGRGAAMHYRQTHMANPPNASKKHRMMKAVNHASPEAAPQQPPVAQIHYCPNCGVSLQVFQTAMSLMVKMQQ